MSSGSPFRDFKAGICFANRRDAGEQLVVAIQQELADRPVAADTTWVVYALPRGGLLVADPIAAWLNCPLDVMVAKKITRPENPELAIGAVTADGHLLWLPRLRTAQFLSESQYEAARQEAYNRAQSQWEQFAPYRPQISPSGAIALLVDDGIATGMTMAVAVQALKSQSPAEIWICVPVAPPEIFSCGQSWGETQEDSDRPRIPIRTVVLTTPTPFNSVSRFYQEFSQVSMETAVQCLAAAQHRHSQFTHDP